MALRLLKSLYVQVLLGMIAGVAVGYFFPQSADALKPLGDVFIKAIRMVIGPIVLCTIVVGIAHAGSAAKVGRLGVKALVLFEVLTTFAMIIGLIVANTFKPGVGINADLASLDVSAVEQYTKAKPAHSLIEFIINMIPGNIVQSFADGDLIHILVFSILLGLAVAGMGASGRKLTDSIETLGHALLRIVGFVMKLAPLAAFGAMAFTIGKYGIETLEQLGKLIACLYLTCAVFVGVVLWALARFGGGISVWKLIRYFKEELLITLGTASSEAVLPRMLEKLENLGCSKAVVGLVIPAGYSFNLTGTSIYLTMAILFMGQALNMPLSVADQISILLVLLFASKGIAGVAGASLVVLAATLSATRIFPVEAMALILGIDRFQNEIRAATNLVGNAVSTIVLARSEGEFDLERATRVLNGETVVALDPKRPIGDDLAPNAP